MRFGIILWITTVTGFLVYLRFTEARNADKPPKKKPSFSCVFFIGSGLCTFKCRIFGEGAQGYCDKYTCICKYQDNIYIEDEDGFHPDPSSKGKTEDTHGRNVDKLNAPMWYNSFDPSKWVSEFSSDDNKLKLKLITLMVFLSKKGTNICDFLRDNHISVDDIRLLSEKEHRQNAMLSRSLSGRSADGILKYGDNIGTIVYNLIPDSCRKKLSGKEAMKKKNIIQNNKIPNDSNYGNYLNLKQKIDQFPKYKNKNKPTKKTNLSPKNSPHHYSLEAPPKPRKINLDFDGKKPKKMKTAVPPKPVKGKPISTDVNISSLPKKTTPLMIEDNSLKAPPKKEGKLPSNGSVKEPLLPEKKPATSENPAKPESTGSHVNNEEKVKEETKPITPAVDNKKEEVEPTLATEGEKQKEGEGNNNNEIPKLPEKINDSKPNLINNKTPEIVESQPTDGKTNIKPPSPKIESEFDTDSKEKLKPEYEYYDDDEDQPNDTEKGESPGSEKKAQSENQIKGEGDIKKEGTEEGKLRKNEPLNVVNQPLKSTASPENKESLKPSPAKETKKRGPQKVSESKHNLKPEDDGDKPDKTADNKPSKSEEKVQSEIQENEQPKIEETNNKPRLDEETDKSLNAEKERLKLAKPSTDEANTKPLSSEVGSKEKTPKVEGIAEKQDANSKDQSNLEYEYYDDDEEKPEGSPDTESPKSDDKMNLKNENKKQPEIEETTKESSTSKEKDKPLETENDHPEPAAPQESEQINRPLSPEANSKEETPKTEEGPEKLNTHSSDRSDPEDEYYYDDEEHPDASTKIEPLNSDEKTQPENKEEKQPKIEETTKPVSSVATELEKYLPLKTEKQEPVPTISPESENNNKPLSSEENSKEEIPKTKEDTEKLDTDSGDGSNSEYEYYYDDEEHPDDSTKIEPSNSDEKMQPENKEEKQPKIEETAKPVSSVATELEKYLPLKTEKQEPGLTISPESENNNKPLSLEENSKDEIPKTKEDTKKLDKDSGDGSNSEYEYYYDDEEHPDDSTKTKPAKSDEKAQFKNESEKQPKIEETSKTFSPVDTNSEKDSPPKTEKEQPIIENEENSKPTLPDVNSKEEILKTDKKAEKLDTNASNQPNSENEYYYDDEENPDDSTKTEPSKSDEKAQFKNESEKQSKIEETSKTLSPVDNNSEKDSPLKMEKEQPKPISPLENEKNSKPVLPEVNSNEETPKSKEITENPGTASADQSNIEYEDYADDEENPEDIVDMEPSKSEIKIESEGQDKNQSKVKGASKPPNSDEGMLKQEKPTEKEKDKTGLIVSPENEKSSKPSPQTSDSSGDKASKSDELTQPEKNEELKLESNTQKSSDNNNGPEKNKLFDVQEEKSKSSAPSENKDNMSPLSENSEIGGLLNKEESGEKPKAAEPNMKENDEPEYEYYDDDQHPGTENSPDPMSEKHSNLPKKPENPETDSNGVKLNTDLEKAKPDMETSNKNEPIEAGKESIELHLELPDTGGNSQKLKEGEGKSEEMKRMDESPKIATDSEEKKMPALSGQEEKKPEIKNEGDHQSGDNDHPMSKNPPIPDEKTVDINSPENNGISEKEKNKDVVLGDAEKSKIASPKEENTLKLDPTVSEKEKVDPLNLKESDVEGDKGKKSSKKPEDSDGNQNNNTENLVKIGDNQENIQSKPEEHGLDSASEFQNMDSEKEVLKNEIQAQEPNNLEREDNKTKNGDDSKINGSEGEKAMKSETPKEESSEQSNSPEGKQNTNLEEKPQKAGQGGRPNNSGKESENKESEEKESEKHSKGKRKHKKPAADPEHAVDTDEPDLEDTEVELESYDEEYPDPEDEPPKEQNDPKRAETSSKPPKPVPIEKPNSDVNAGKTPDSKANSDSSDESYKILKEYYEEEEE